MEQLLSLPTLQRLRILANFREPSVYLHIWDRCSPIPTRSAPIALESLWILTLRYMSEWLMHDLYPLDISHLKLLSLDRATDQLLRWPKFAPALRTIEILDFAASFNTNVVDLSSLPNLVLVRIAVADDGCLMALDALSTISTPNCIRKIVIHGGFLDRLCCEQLDCKLASLPVHSGPTVEFEMDSIWGGLTIDDVHQYFPQMASRNLNFSGVLATDPCPSHRHVHGTPEILGEIFLELMDNCISSAAVAQGPQWSASQVCRAWRDAALSTSPLWATFTVVLDHPQDSTTFPYQLLITQAHIRRSGSIPLSLKVEMASLRTARPLMTSHVVLDALVSVSTRWGCIEFSSNFDASLFASLAPVYGSLQSLTTVVFKFRHPGNTTLHMFSVAPQLRHATVWIRGPLDEYVPVQQAVVLPWSQLTSLSVCHSNVLHLRPILTQCPSLVDCTIIGYYRPSTQHLKAPYILPNLVKLIIRGPETVLDELILPSLRSFMLAIDLRYITRPAHVLNFFRRSGGKLAILVYRGRYPLHSFCAPLDGLVELSINELHDDDIEGMTRLPGTPMSPSRTAGAENSDVCHPSSAAPPSHVRVAHRCVGSYRGIASHITGRRPELSPASYPE
ncbi:hypothetical protein FB451DRAFT_1564154 [Mycena latifolia]|nr:hypothetical protein FB451DRAFT_1564154 [Mycena latifolia]